ncbi:MAG TPA: anthranilate synthase component I family protein [Plantibacter sp.]|uniref:anthranilate synthase component I family protein n=1 Tax=unclassified Plantibacter TaxID=2624265 RepID=UPI002C83F289|nr:anthranilate synthase component I family protein [Plantibacter sp.]
MNRIAGGRELVLAGWHDPEEVFLRLFATEPWAVWLDSGQSATTGTSMLGAGTERLVAHVPNGTVEHVREDLSVAVLPGSILDALRFVRSGHSDDWVGWLGYEYGATLVGAPVAPGSLPDAVLLRVTDRVVFDHGTRTVTLSSGDPDWIRWASARLAEEREPRLLAPRRGVECTPRHTDSDYVRLVERCQEHITRGDAYQLCLTNQLRVDGVHDALSTYRRLRAASPSHHGGFLRLGDVSLVSSSPEQFLEVTVEGTVRTKPIKGTRPRGLDREDDARLRAELLASEKERAENLMIVDLMRNDLARVSVLGSVAVTALHRVESYPQVHQLVSTVEGRLRPGSDGLDVIEACFPAGSMTGAPKRRAMDILYELEGGPRGPYAGAFGVLRADGSVDLAMVIRTIVIDSTGASIGAGGGITAMSVPEEELEEAWTKAAAPLAALGVGRPDQESR